MVHFVLELKVGCLVYQNNQLRQKINKVEQEKIAPKTQTATLDEVLLNEYQSYRSEATTKKYIGIEGPLPILRTLDNGYQLYKYANFEILLPPNWKVNDQLTIEGLLFSSMGQYSDTGLNFYKLTRDYPKGLEGSTLEEMASFIEKSNKMTPADISTREKITLSDGHDAYQWVNVHVSKRESGNYFIEEFEDAELFGNILCKYSFVQKSNGPLYPCDELIYLVSFNGQLPDGLLEYWNQMVSQLKFP